MVRWATPYRHTSSVMMVDGTSPAMTPSAHSTMATPALPSGKRWRSRTVASAAAVRTSTTTVLAGIAFATVACTTPVPTTNAATITSTLQRGGRSSTGGASGSLSRTLVLSLEGAVPLSQGRRRNSSCVRGDRTYRGCGTPSCHDGLTTPRRATANMGTVHPIHSTSRRDRTDRDTVYPHLKEQQCRYPCSRPATSTSRMVVAPPDSRHSRVSRSISTPARPSPLWAKADRASRP